MQQSAGEIIRKVMRGKFAALKRALDFQLKKYPRVRAGTYENAVWELTLWIEYDPASHDQRETRADHGKKLRVGSLNQEERETLIAIAKAVGNSVKGLQCVTRNQGKDLRGVMIFKICPVKAKKNNQPLF